MIWFDHKLIYSFDILLFRKLFTEKHQNRASDQCLWSQEYENYLKYIYIYISQFERINLRLNEDFTSLWIWILTHFTWMILLKSTLPVADSCFRWKPAKPVSHKFGNTISPTRCEGDIKASKNLVSCSCCCCHFNIWDFYNNNCKETKVLMGSWNFWSICFRDIFKQKTIAFKNVVHFVQIPFLNFVSIHFFTGSRLILALLPLMYPLINSFRVLNCCCHIELSYILCVILHFKTSLPFGALVL